MPLCHVPTKIVQVKLVITVNMDCEIQCRLWGRSKGNPLKKRGMAMELFTPWTMKSSQGHVKFVIGC